MAPQSNPKPHKIDKKSAQALKKQIFENEHLAYTRHSFSRVQGPKNTPKANQKHSKDPSKIALIFASILNCYFYRFWLHFGTPLGSLWAPKSLKRERRGKREGGPGANCAPKAPTDATRPPKSLKKHPIWTPITSKIMPKGCC